MGIYQLLRRNSASHVAAPRLQAFRETLLVFLLLFATYACFLQGPGWNTTPRLAMTAEFVQHGRFSIDEYAHLTGDKSLQKGHYYSDKAPGMSLLAMPAALIFTQFGPITSEVFGSPAWTMFAYVCTLSVSGFISAFAGAMLFSFVRRRTGRLDAALVGALTFGLATPVFGWSTHFFGHATTAAFLMIGFIALDVEQRPKPLFFREVAGGIAGNLPA